MSEYDDYARMSSRQKSMFHARRAAEAAKNRGLKILQRGGDGPVMAFESHMPKGGTLSPGSGGNSDLGALRGAEARKVFGSIITSKPVEASRMIPAARMRGR